MNHFSPRAQKVLALARREADRLNHNYVGTEHLFLGLISLGQGVAVRVLVKLGLNLETIRIELEKLIGVAPEAGQPGVMLFTPPLRKVLALAGEQAGALQHSYIGTEHMLLGLLREDGNPAARVLKTLGLDLERARFEVLQELAPNFAYERNRTTFPTPLKVREFIDLRLKPPAEAGQPNPAMIPSNFTPRTKQALALAREEAARFNHDSVSTEHLLLGMIKLGTGVVINVLQKLGIDLKTLRLEVEKQIDTHSPEIKELEGQIEDLRNRKEAAIRAQDFPQAAALRDLEKEAKEKLDLILGERLLQDIPSSQQLNCVLELADEETKMLNHSYIGTEHLLLGLLREGESPAAHILHAMGADFEKTRSAVLGELDPNYASGESKRSTTEEINAKVQELSRHVEVAEACFHLKKLEAEIRLTREELSRKLEAVVAMLEALKNEISRLRDDVRKTDR